MKKKTPNTQTHKKTIRRGLSIYKIVASPYWIARIWNASQKKYVYRSTKETSRLVAEEVAEEILHDLKEKKIVASIPNQRSFRNFAEKLMRDQERLAGKDRHPLFAKEDAYVLNGKDTGVLKYFGHRDIGSIKTSDIREYLNWVDDKSEKSLSASTRSKRVIVIRKVLKLAIESGAIDGLPEMPPVRRVDNPRPSFTEKEYKHLLKITREVVKEGVKVRGIPITLEMYYFIVFMTHSFLRTTESEVFALRHRDITEEQNPRRLVIEVQGKTGYRPAITTRYAPVFYKHIQKNIHPDYNPDDYVFFPKYKNRSTAKRLVNRQFNYLLEQAKLKKTNDGRNRTPYALRHYALQIRFLKSKGKLNILLLAKTAGTSVDQLERFYLKYLPMTDDQVLALQIEG